MADDLIRLATASFAAFVALIFLRAVLHKTADLMRFEGIVADYRLAPHWALPVLRFLIPGLELTCAVALAWAGSRLLGSLAAALLLIGYGAAMAVNLRRGRIEIDCGCGGAPERLSWVLVFRNLAFVALLVPSVLEFGEGLTSEAVLTSWAIAIIAFGIWGAAEQLLVNQARMGAGRRATLNWLIGAGS